VPGFESPPLWGGYLAPAGLPQPVAERLTAEILKALAASDLRARMEDAGLNVVAGTPEMLAATMKSNVARLEKIVKAAGIEPE
jgi:tripartite-type tricarboxylate transporter receptor subunit TctC